jgi:hypothetical protein
MQLSPKQPTKFYIASGFAFNSSLCMTTISAAVVQLAAWLTGFMISIEECVERSRTGTKHAIVGFFFSGKRDILSHMWVTLAIAATTV